MPPGAMYFQNVVWVIIVPLCFWGMLQLAESLWSRWIPLNRTLFLKIATQEAEQSEPRSAEVLKKPKTAIPSTSKRPKKEAKKKR